MAKGPKSTCKLNTQIERPVARGVSVSTVHMARKIAQFMQWPTAQKITNESTTKFTPSSGNYHTQQNNNKSLQENQSLFRASFRVQSLFKVDIVQCPKESSGNGRVSAPSASVSHCPQAAWRRRKCLQQRGRPSRRPGPRRSRGEVYRHER